MARKCKGLNTRGRLVSGYRWTKGASCPKKAKAKKASSGKKRGRKKGGDRFALVREYEAWKKKNAGKQQREALERNVADLYARGELYGSRRRRR